MSEASTPYSRLEMSPIRSPKPSRSWTQKYWNLANSLWLWEFCGWSLSTACLMTIVGLLAHYNGKPLRDWPHSITLNSTLAILSAVSKSALMIPVAAGLGQLKWTRLRKGRKLYDLQRFDDASRGPLGSVSLIWRGGILAFVGTLIVITGLAFEPFIQQIVAYPPQKVDQGVVASIPRSANYSAYIFEGTSAPTPTIADDMKAAVYTGLYTNATAVIPLCPSGNCTWNLFDSVAVCSTCVDTTEDITMTNPTADNPIWGSTSGCIMTLPNGLGLALAPPALTAYRTVFNLSENTSANILPGGWSSSMADFASIYYENGQSANCTQPHGAAKATECKMYWCVNTYNSSVYKNTFEEFLVASKPMSTNLTGAGNWNQLGFYYKANDTTYVVADGVQASIQGYLEAAIFPNGTALLSTSHYNMAYSSDIISRLFHAAAPTWLYDDHIGQYTQGIANLMDNIAQTMTTNVRTTSSGSGPSFDGIAWEELTYIHVRWAWLALPLALDLLAMVFLLGVIIQSIRTKTEPWKSSQLVTIFRGSSLRDLTDFGSPGGLVEMNNVAKTVKISLQESESMGGSKRLVEVS